MNKEKVKMNEDELKEAVETYLKMLLSGIDDFYQGMDPIVKLGLSRTQVENEFIRRGVDISNRYIRIVLNKLEEKYANTK